MEKYRHLTKSNKRIELCVLLLLSLLVSHIMVVKGERYSLREFLHMSEYYIALGASFFIVISLILSIMGVNRFLDKRYPWKKTVGLRLLWQLLLGVVFIAALAYGLALVYFQYRGVPIQDTDYLSNDFLPIVEFVILVNFFYFTRFAYLSLLVPLWHRLNRSPPVHEIQSPGKFRWKQQKLPSNKIVLYRFIDKHVFSFTREGGKNIENHSLKKLQEELDPKKYFRVNAQTIVHHTLIRSVKKSNVSSRQLVLTLDHGECATTTVSQNRIPSFKAWFRDNVRNVKWS